MKKVFCNIVDGNRVRSGMCACVHLHRSMLAHICFVGSALSPGSSKSVSCWPKIDFRDRKFLREFPHCAGPQLASTITSLHADCSILGLALRATICLVPCMMCAVVYRLYL